MAKGSNISRHALSAPLSPELAQEHKVRSMVIREGDTVAVQRGSFQDVEGKVTSADHKRGRVLVEGVTREKADGSTKQVPIHASKVVIRRLALDDERRREILERRAAAPQQGEEKPKSGQGRKRAETKTGEAKQGEGR